MTTRNKLINTDEGLQAIVDSFKGSQAGDLDKFSSGDESHFSSAVCAATCIVDDSGVYCGGVGDLALSESRDDDSWYENDSDDLDSCPEPDASRSSRSRSPITIPGSSDNNTPSFIVPTVIV